MTSLHRSPTLLISTLALCTILTAAPSLPLCGDALTSTAHAQGRNKNKALTLAGQAREAFTEQRYEEAAQLLEQAFDAYPNKNFIWNTGRAWELAGRFVRAETSYRRFSGLSDITDDERTQASKKLARLEALRTIPNVVQTAHNDAVLDAVLPLAASGSQSSQSPSDPTSSSGPSGLGILGWTSATLGVLALGTTLTLHLASIDTVEEYNTTAAQGRDRAKYNALNDTLQTRSTTSLVLLVSGSLLTAAGGTLLYFEYFDNDEPTAQAQLPSTPSKTLSLSPTWSPEHTGVSFSLSY